jgi:hypothetical protein
MIRGVPKRWRNQYWNDYDETWIQTLSGDSKKVYEKLCELDLETCSHKEVQDITGNFSWTHDFCAECDEFSTHGYEFGKEFFCTDCVKKLISLFKETEPARGED